MSFELHHFQALQQPSEVGIVLPTFTGEIIEPKKLAYLRTHSQLRLNPVQTSGLADSQSHTFPYYTEISPKFQIKVLLEY